MNILFIGKRFYTNRDALNEKYGRIHQLPWHWAKSGHPTSLWLVDYHTRDTVRTSEDALQITSTPVRNLRVFWHWLSGNYRRSGPVDLVVASGDCYIGCMGLCIAHRMHSRFALDVYDKYDEFGGYIRLPGFDLFNYLLTHADVRLFASRGLMQDMQRSPLDCLVPNGLDTGRFKPLDMSTSRDSMALPHNTLLVGYFGSMEPDRGVGDLIDAVSLLRARNMSVQLILGGKLSSELNIHNPAVRYLGDIPYDKMPMALAACDLLAIPYRRSTFMDAGASNKIAEAIACRRPIVATRTPNLLTNFPEQSKQLDGLLAEPNNPESLAHSIQAQSQLQVLVDLPTNMSWQDIASDTINRLSGNEYCTRRSITSDKNAHD